MSLVCFLLAIIVATFWFAMNYSAGVVVKYYYMIKKDKFPKEYEEKLDSGELAFAIVRMKSAYEKPKSKLSIAKETPDDNKSK